jgi:hypothetical protein
VGSFVFVACAVDGAIGPVKSGGWSVVAVPLGLKLDAHNLHGLSVTTGGAVVRVRDVAAGAAAAGAVADVIEPQAAFHGIYDDMYGRYRRLFDSLKPMFAG